MPRTRKTVSGPRPATSRTLRRGSAEVVPPRPPHDEIARMAYAIYQANGSRNGFDLDDWLEAERLLAANQNRDSTPATPLDVMPSHVVMPRTERGTVSPFPRRQA